jgi:predicted peptidase
MTMNVLATACLSTLLLCNAAVAALPGVAPARLEQAPEPAVAAPMYRQTGEQYRVYEFPGTGEPIPYRLYVPETWKPGQQLPVLVTLRAGTSLNNNHRGGNDLVRLARERGYIVISPLGYRGLPQPYYGSSWPVDREAGPSVPAAGWTQQESQRAELDVLYVLNLVASEYGADTSRLFLHGQNPSGSAAFHFAAQYPTLEGRTAVMLLAGDRDSKYTAAASERLAGELARHGVKAEFHLVPGGEHLNAYLLFAPQVFDFLARP